MRRLFGGSSSAKLASESDGSFPALAHADSFDSHFQPSPPPSSPTKRIWTKLQCTSCANSKDHDEELAVSQSRRNNKSRTNNKEDNNIMNYQRRFYMTASEVEDTFDVVSQNLVIVPPTTASADTAGPRLDTAKTIPEELSSKDLDVKEGLPSVTEDYSSSYMTDASSQSSGLPNEDSLSTTSSREDHHTDKVDEPEEDNGPLTDTDDDGNNRIGIRPFIIPTDVLENTSVQYNLLSLEDNIVSTDRDSDDEENVIEVVLNKDHGQKAQDISINLTESSSEESNTGRPTQSKWVSDDMGEDAISPPGHVPTEQELYQHGDIPSDVGDNGHESDCDDSYSRRDYGPTKPKTKSISGSHHKSYVTTDADATTTTAEDSAYGDHSDGSFMNHTDSVPSPPQEPTVLDRLELRSSQDFETSGMSSSFETADAVQLSRSQGSPSGDSAEKIHGGLWQKHSTDSVDRAEKLRLPLKNRSREWTASRSYAVDHSQPKPAVRKPQPEKSLETEAPSLRRSTKSSRTEPSHESKLQTTDGIAIDRSTYRSSVNSSTQKAPKASNTKLKSLIHKFEPSNAVDSEQKPHSTSSRTVRSGHLASNIATYPYKENFSKATEASGVSAPSTSFFWRSHPQQQQLNPPSTVKNRRITHVKNNHGATSSSSSNDIDGSTRTGFVDPLVRRRQEMALKKQETSSRPSWAR